MSATITSEYPDEECQTCHASADIWCAGCEGYFCSNHGAKKVHGCKNNCNKGLE